MQIKCLVLSCLCLVASTSLARAETVDESTRKEVQSFFQQLHGQIKAGETKGIVPLLNIDRFFEDVVADLSKFKLDEALKERVTPQMQSRLAEVFLRDPRGWKRCRITNIESLRRNELRVVVRHWNDFGEPLRLQFWLSKSNNRWAIYDVMDFGFGFRVTDSVTVLLDQLAEVRQRPNLGPKIKSFQAMMLALQEGDIETAHESFDAIEDTALIPLLDGVKWTCGAILARQKEDPHLILKYLSLAKEKNVVTPLADHLKAVAYNLLGEPAEALEHAQTFVDQFGLDPTNLLEIGIAYEQLGESAKAIQQYRTALEDTPDSWQNLAALGIALDDAQKSEVTTRFSRFQTPRLFFEMIAEEFTIADDAAAINALLVDYRKTHAEDPNVDYYTAASLYIRKDFAGAAKITLAAFRKVAGDDIAESFHALYFECMIAQKKVVEAYRNAPDKAKAFAFLCDELFNASDYDSVLQLVGARRVDAPRSPYVEYYLGDAHFYRERYQDADNAYAKVGPLDTDDELKEDVRQSRVACWFHLEKGEAAYGKFLPQQSTFEQLCSLADEYLDVDLLEKLLNKHGETQDPPLIAFYRGVVAWEQKKYKDIPIILQPYIEHYFKEFDESQAVRIEDYVIRSCLRAKNFELAYRLAQRSTRRDGDSFYEAIVLGVHGNVAESIEQIDQCLGHGYRSIDFIDDDDLAPVLVLEKNKKLRSRLLASTNPGSKNEQAGWAVAQKRWPELAKAFSDNNRRICAVNASFVEDGQNENIWLVVTKIENGKITGVLNNAPKQLTKLKNGDAVSVELKAVRDWMYANDKGNLIGLFGVRPIDESNEQ